MAIAQSNKKMLYVGGIADEVTEKIVHGAFIPFGDIADITIPLDYSSQKHRGFAFVEFESAGTVHGQRDLLLCIFIKSLPFAPE